jgi:predicted RNase H-like HicB family nuclease
VSHNIDVDYTALYIKSGEWWAATVEEIPGVNTQGRTLEEARANLQEALQLVLDAARADLAESTKGEEVVKEIIHLKAS